MNSIFNTLAFLGPIGAPELIVILVVLIIGIGVPAVIVVTVVLISNRKKRAAQQVNQPETERRDPPTQQG